MPKGLLPLSTQDSGKHIKSLPVTLGGVPDLGCFTTLTVIESVGSASGSATWCINLAGASGGDGSSGSHGNALSMPDSANFDFLASNWTVECWTYITSIPSSSGNSTFGFGGHNTSVVVKKFTA